MVSQPHSTRSRKHLPLLVRVRVRVRVRRNEECHNSAGQKVGKLEVLWESEKAVDNRCSGRSGCLVRSPCCGNSTVLKLFLGGKGLSLRLCVHPRVVVRRLSILHCVGSFYACVWCEKKGVAVLSARGTT